MTIDKKRIKFALLFSIVLVAIFIIDWFTKDYFFNDEEINKGIEYNHTIIGIRSVAHYNTTLLSSVNASIPVWAHHLINFSLVLIFSTFALFANKKITIIGLGILVGGMLGNAMDKIFTVGEKGETFVRDIFYIPWLKNGSLGTFNAADTFVVIGAMLMALSTFISLMKSSKEVK